MATAFKKLGVGGTIGPDNPSWDEPWFVTGTEDEDIAIAALAAQVPAIVVIDGRTLTFLNYDLRHIGNGKWEATANYRQREPKQVGDSSYAFDTTGGTAHITQAIEETFATSGAPDFKGAIGVSGDNIEGVDIEVRGFAFSETHYLPTWAVTPVWIRKLFLLTKCVNTDPWVSTQGFEFEAGEVRFRGAQGSQRGADDVEITFHFIAEPNRLDIEVGDFTGIQKKGQEYLWVRYEDAVSSDQWAKQPSSVHVDQVYEYGNFAHLLPWSITAAAATTGGGTLATAYAAGQVVDGVTLALGDRILIKNQVTTSENGLYIVTAGAPTRATNADSESELLALLGTAAGGSAMITGGTVNGQTQWAMTTVAPITVGVTGLTFAQVA